MAPIKRFLRIILYLHAAINMTQGLYATVKPAEYGKFVGHGFEDAPVVTLQSIGLGLIGVGTYGIHGALNNDRGFYLTTFSLRSVFAILAWNMWGWSSNSDVIIYEASVAALAGLAYLTW